MRGSTVREPEVGVHGCMQENVTGTADRLLKAKQFYIIATV